MLRSSILTASAALGCLLAAGCGSPPPPVVEAGGVVTLNGKPLPHAEVQFVPTHEGLDGNYISTAVTDDAGRYTLALPGGRTGTCACEHMVTVAEGPLPDDARGQSAAAQMKASRFMAGLKNRPIPDKYGSVAQSPLKMTVAADRKDYPIDITR